MPYRKAASKLADIVGQEGYVVSASVWNKKQDEGERLNSLQHCFIENVLKDHRAPLEQCGLVPSSEVPSQPTRVTPDETEATGEQEPSLSESQQEELDELVRHFVPDFAGTLKNEPPDEVAAATSVPGRSRCHVEENTVSVQLDEVVTKSQEPDKKTNLTYTATVEDSDGRCFYLASATSEALFALVATHLAMLGLLTGKRLDILSDGANWIMAWSFGIAGIECVRILCWYHLSKRIYESLSGQGYSREERQGLEREILGYLWRGESSRAVLRLWELRSHCRNEKRMNDLIGYILRKKSSLVNYQERWESGLWIASTRVEKWNAEAVSNRCKHHGMSWTGSGVMSQALCAASLNREKCRKEPPRQNP